MVVRIARCIITVLTCLILLAGVSSVLAAPVRVAAASSLRSVWPKLMQAAPDDLQTTISYGSSGNLARQIIQSAPFAVFLSASDVHVQALRDALDGPLESKLYALGQLALVTRQPTDGETAVTLDNLAAELAAGQAAQPAAEPAAEPAANKATALEAEPGAGQPRRLARRLAIANPAHAPYGKAAREVLENLDAWPLARSSLSLAENAAQTLQFVRAGAVWAALVPRSLVNEPSLREDLHIVDIDPRLHEPIRHVMALLTPADPSAVSLYDFLQSPAAQGILEDAGFGMKPRDR